MSNAGGCLGGILLIGVIGFAFVGFKSCFFDGGEKAGKEISASDTASSSQTVAGKSEYKFIPVPRSVAGDLGTYEILENEFNGNVVTVLHKRTGVDSVGYTRAKVNCSTMKRQDVGYLDYETSNPAAFPDPPKGVMPSQSNPMGEVSKKWYALEKGSSAYDVAKAACALRQ